MRSLDGWWTASQDLNQLLEKSYNVWAVVLLLVTQHGRPGRQQAYLVHGDSQMVKERSEEMVRQRLLLYKTKGFNKHGGLT